MKLNYEPVDMTAGVEVPSPYKGEGAAARSSLALCFLGNFISHNAPTNDQLEELVEELIGMVLSSRRNSRTYSAHSKT
jgi:hypothetical protein